MRMRKSVFPDSRWIAIGCAIGATSLGLAYMIAAGAPLRYLAINAGALVVGFGLGGLLATTWRHGRAPDGVLTLVLGVFLMASSLFGVTVNGATRWISIAGVSLQPSLLLIPLMVVRFARSRDVLSMSGLVLAGLAVALQPDRGMAGALLTGLVVLAVLRPERWVLIALAVASAALVATLIQVDAQPAVPFVDQIFFTSFDVHPLAGFAVLAGAALLIAPAFAGRVGHPGTRHAHAVFGAIWLAVIVAAALGNYPTPLVGYGGSAIIGYVLSSFGLPATAGDGAAQPKEILPGTAREDPDSLRDARFHRNLGLAGPA